MSNHCPTCRKWTIRNANFCHHCGHALATSFHYEMPAGSHHQYDTVSPTHPGDWKDKASTTILLVSVTGIGAITGTLEPSYMFLIPAGYLLWPTANKMLLDVLGKLPERERQAPQDKSVTLRIEHKSEDNRHWLLADMPQGIELSHLQHIAREYLQNGKPFSRHGLCETGKLSQVKYNLIRDFFLQYNYALPKNKAAPKLGVIPTERGKRLLKKTLVD